MKRFDCEDEPNEFMEAPCRCDCGKWFDLDDGYPDGKGNIVCRECNGEREAEDDSDVDDYDESYEEEREEEENFERACACTCGAWVVGKDGRGYHVADCYCGAE